MRKVSPLCSCSRLCLQATAAQVTMLPVLHHRFTRRLSNVPGPLHAHCHHPALTCLFNHHHISVPGRGEWEVRIKGPPANRPMMQLLTLSFVTNAKKVLRVYLAQSHKRIEPPSDCLTCNVFDAENSYISKSNALACP